MTRQFRIAWCGDAALRVTPAPGLDPTEVESARRLAHWAGILRAARIPGVADAVSSYHSVMVGLAMDGAPPAGEPATPATPSSVERDIAGALGEVSASAPPPSANVVEVPVLYGGEHGPDLSDVAGRTGLSPEAVVKLHANATYEVLFLGFLPGFAYLHGLPSALATPRLERPRALVPAGSVAIGGGQTGVYPSATPGGWRIIGRTPRPLLQPEREPTCLLQPGDGVRFVPVTAAEFDELAARGE